MSVWIIERPLPIEIVETNVGHHQELGKKIKRMTARVKYDQFMEFCVRRCVKSVYIWIIM